MHINYVAYVNPAIPHAATLLPAPFSFVLSDGVGLVDLAHMYPFG